RLRVRRQPGKLLLDRARRPGGSRSDGRPGARGRRRTARQGPGRARLRAGDLRVPRRERALHRGAARLPGLIAVTHAEILRRFYEGWNGGNPGEGTLQFLHERFEYVNPESAVEPGTRHGHAGWQEAGKSADRAFSEM